MNNEVVGWCARACRKGWETNIVLCVA